MSEAAPPPPPEKTYTNSECQHGCISRNKLNLLKSILDAVSGNRVDIIKNNVDPIIEALEKRVIKRVGTSNIVKGQFTDKELLEFSQTDVEEETYTLPDNPDNLKSKILGMFKNKALEDYSDEAKLENIENNIENVFKSKVKREAHDGKFIKNERKELKSNLEALALLLLYQKQYIEFTEFKTKKTEILRNLQTIIEDLSKNTKLLSEDSNDKTRIFNEFQKIYNEQYPALGANQTQQYELGSFLYKDSTFSKNFELRNNGENIDIIDKNKNNEIYVMKPDGGIEKSERGNLEGYIYFIADNKIGFRKFDFSKDRKISRLSQNDLLDFLPERFHTTLPNIEEVQKRELAAFLNYDKKFEETYTIDKNPAGEITFTDKENNKYIMRKDGGIVIMNGSNAVNYIYDTTSKNIRFREATWRDTNRLLQNRQGWWGGKTKKRIKNAKKRRKTRRK
jgi:hypothetical protein